MSDLDEIGEAYSEYAALQAAYDAAIQGALAGEAGARDTAIALVPARDAAWKRLEAAIPVRAGLS